MLLHPQNLIYLFCIFKLYIYIYMKIIYFLLTCCYSYMNLDWEIEKKLIYKYCFLQWCIRLSVFWAFPFVPQKSLAKKWSFSTGWKRKSEGWKGIKKVKKIWKHFLAEWELVTAMFQYRERERDRSMWEMKDLKFLRCNWSWTEINL